MEPKGIVSEIRVLVVDDNEFMRKMVAIILSKHGYQYELVNNGVEAIQRIREKRFDAVVTDIEMPEMDGITLTRELSRHFSDLPVLIMTSHSDDDYQETAIRAGAKQFLSKPFGVSDLITRLHRMLPDDKLAIEPEA